jgi:hypothetical protein
MLFAYYSRNLLRSGLFKFILASQSSSRHLFSKKHSSCTMNVIPVEALSDNYMYLLVDEATKECAAVDPVEPDSV